MILTEEDLKILKVFLEKTNEDLTTWKVMKHIYPKGSDIEHVKIKRRLDRLSENGLIFVTKTKPKNYFLIKDFIKLNHFPKMKKYISIKIDNLWEIFQVT